MQEPLLVERAQGLGVGLEHAVHETFGGASQDRERRADLVRDVADELPSQGVLPLHRL